jgi:hypothetical protein
MVLILFAASLPQAAAQGYPPTIFDFSSDLPSVTMAALESGEVMANLRWHVAHVTDEHRVLLFTYQENRWVTINGYENPLPPVGTQPIKIEHPRNFGPPTFLLAVVDRDAKRVDERVLVIPYDTATMAALSPTIETFSTTATSVDPAQLAAGSARVEVSWEIKDRLPQTNLVFEQVIGETEAKNIELPRANLWIASSGTGQVAPVAVQGATELHLRLRLVHVISADVLAEALLDLPVAGPAANNPPAAPTPTLAASAPGMVGDLAVMTACTSFVNPQRGWIDGPMVQSPDGQYVAHVTNPDGAAQLIITRADGSAPVTVNAPNPGIPLAIHPRWSPDSQRLVFANSAISQPGGGVIYTVNRDGSGLVSIAEYIGYHDDLSWSPDGAQIYFTSGTASGSGSGMSVGAYKVYAVAAGGGQPQVVTDGCALLP